MIRSTLLLLAGSLVLAAAPDEAPPDLLRLSNGELEGRFGGIDRDGVLRWERDDGIAPMEFRTDKVRQIILRGGGSLQTDASTSHVELVNGDQLPATITALDESGLTLESDTAGPLVIPRDAVRRIAPNPFGGRLVFAGPFNPEAWTLDDGSEPSAAGEENAEPEEEPEEQPDAEKEEPDAEESEPNWRHIGSRWYRVSGEEAITVDPGMPGRSIFRFRLEWRGRTPISVGFHSDFAPLPPLPEPDEEDEADGEDEGEAKVATRSNSGLTSYFGRSLAMTLRGNYVNLYQTGYDKEGQPFVNSLRASSRSLRIDNNGEADFEIRSDLEKGFISLFVDGEFAMQWQIDPVDPDDEDSWTPGTGLGFRVDGSDTNPVRISEIFVAEWNGMPDSARSLENEERDIVLLTNGTDRVSGTVKSIVDGRLTLEGKYAPLVIPTDEIAEIRFATGTLREPEGATEDQIRVHFQPIGTITGSPGVTRDDTMALKSALLGELSLSLENAVILEFRQGGSFLDAWDDDF